MTTASQRAWSRQKPRAPASHPAKESWTGHPSSVATKPSRLVHMRVRIVTGFPRFVRRPK